MALSLVTVRLWTSYLTSNKDSKGLCLVSATYRARASLVTQRSRIRLQCRRQLGFDPWVGKISWRRNPLQYSCQDNPMDRGGWQATVHRVVRVGHDLVTKPPLTSYARLFTYIKFIKIHIHSFNPYKHP